MVPSCTARIPFPDVKTIVVIGATGHFGAESFSHELREAASNTAVIAAAIYLMVSKNWS